MQTIKIQRGTNRLRLDGTWYKPYLVSGLPPSFAFKHEKIEDKEGIYKWFNYKGLTYIRDKN